MSGGRPGALTRVLSALLAAAAIAGILVGVPALFVTIAPPLLADAVPPGTAPMDLLLRPDNGTLLLGFVAAVGVGSDGLNWPQMDGHSWPHRRS